ncbi:3-deoxy-D-manno-octulosonic acid transferase [Christiangramia forsetii]|uniref:3-deoxy-D-manno-octulosonic acid transferase n=2 Tax=Christiangramia forsetii TaxID=411153 RepID=A0LY14_CHRFK|nr:glycosyltransferase N-terminal domain-containing protein [Christiangramia forsetii]GGG35260.1 3-deoxy-D-manno-octulosonic acid transferase [Christiangramia forsetii]CAL65259.1 3-deoxy-D-manno-octulosonic-acid transferase [Christiangramia forsetii KT0803]
MHRIYNLLVKLSGVVLKSAGSFSPKLKEFTEGRKDLFSKLEKNIDPSQEYLWIHAASLGEFEMAVPVLKMLKEKYPDTKTVVSFFSPSGYKNKKQHPLVDNFTYLPLDTPGNAENFLNIVQPKMAFFIKYDFWPNFLNELKKRQIRTFLVSGVFRKDQAFFKAYGKWMRKSLLAFEHFFVQNKESEALLNSIGFNNVTIGGDTRFDRVAAQIEADNRIDFIEEFKEDKILVVCGSTWPDDEKLLLKFINSSTNIKFIIAPHEIKAEKIEQLERELQIPSIRFSEKKGKDLKNYSVLILDTIGFLGRAYSYANIAYVGGAAGTTGLHNILEPATFGIPIIIGENFSKFPEAERLRQLAGLFSVKNSEELSAIMNKLFLNSEFRDKTGMIAGHYINSNTGATRILEKYL